jgi:hypothetical protein
MFHTPSHAFYWLLSYLRLYCFSLTSVIALKTTSHCSLKTLMSYNGRVSDEPRRLPRYQRTQGHNSTLYRRQHRFMYCLCSKQNCLLCAYECDFGDNGIITIVRTGLTKKNVAFCQY